MDAAYRPRYRRRGNLTVVTRLRESLPWLLTLWGAVLLSLAILDWHEYERFIFLLVFR